MAEFKASNAQVERISEEQRELLISQHMPMVHYTARNLQRRLPAHMELSDLVSAGVVGLVECLDRYQGGRDVQFGSFAQFRVRGAMLDFLRSLDWSPRELRRQARNISQTTELLGQRLGRAPLDTEVASELGIDLREFHKLAGEVNSLYVGSLHEVVSEEGSEEQIDFVCAPESESPLVQALRGEQRDRLAGAIAKLPERERLVVTLYYHEELTMREIGQVLGIVESRVSQLHRSAIRRLQAGLGAAKSAKTSVQGGKKTGTRRLGKAA